MVRGQRPFGIPADGNRTIHFRIDLGRQGIDLSNIELDIFQSGEHAGGSHGPLQQFSGFSPELCFQYHLRADPQGGRNDFIKILIIFLAGDFFQKAVACLVYCKPAQ